MSAAEAGRAVGPAAPWAAAAVAGAVGSPMVAELGRQVAWALAAVGTASVAYAAVRRNGSRHGRMLLATFGVLCVAAGCGAVRHVAMSDGPLASLAASGGARELEAVVAEEPRPSRSGWWAIVRVERVGDVQTRERALLRGEDEPPALGSRWVGSATAAPVGPDGFSAYLRQRYTAVRIDPRGWQEQARPRPALALTDTLRSRVRTAARRALPPAHAGLATGLVTGDTTLLPPEVERAMRDTGLTHLVAVSGSNVAVVVAGLLGLAAVVRARPRARRALVAVGLAWFVVLTRWEPSVLRACTMAAIVLAAGFRGVVGDPRHALAVAVLVLVLVDPGIAGSLGMLLSAGATAGVLVVAPLVRQRFAWVPGRSGDLLSVTVGAQLAVAPILLWTVGEVPVASIPANLLAVPAAAVASVLAIGGAVIAAFVTEAAVPLFALTRPALAVVLGAAEHLGSWSAVVSLQRPLTVAAAAVATWWVIASHRRRVVNLAAVATLASFLVPLGPLGGVRGLVVTAIDVGQGDAILVEAPGAVVLVDGGGDERAATWLRRAGRDRFDAVIVSHGHADHVAGLPAVIRRSDLGALWTPDVPVDLPEYAQLLRLVEERGGVVVHPLAGQRTVVGGLAMEVLAPPPGRAYRVTDSELNDTSIVVRVSYGGRAALLTGDVEEPAQRDLLASAPGLRAGLLKVPHHGAGTTEPGFLRATGARVALVSVGRGNRYGHPAPRTIETLERMGAEVRRTDLEGTIRMPVPPLEPELEAARRAGEVSATPPGRPGPTTRIVSRHAPEPRLPPRRRRRPPPAPRARAPPGRAAPGDPGPRRRAHRCGRGHRTAGDAHRLAVRR